MPFPKHMIQPDKIESAIHQALKNAEEKQIMGKQLTPFLLDSIRHITEGVSLKTNKSLIENNASLATEIAIALKL